MKKTLAMIAIGIGSMMLGQSTNVETVSPYQKNNLFVGVGTNGLTGLGFSNVEGSKTTTWNVGIQGGYFVENNLALVAGGRYTHLQKNVDVLHYLGGVRSYLWNVLPVQVDYNGSNRKESNIGVQVGYAFKPVNYLTIEPNLRYDSNLKSRTGDVFSGGLEVNYFFK